MNNFFRIALVVVIGTVLTVVIVSGVAMLAQAGDDSPDERIVANFLLREGHTEDRVREILNYPTFPMLNEAGDLFVVGTQRWVSPCLRQAFLIHFGLRDSCCTMQILYNYAESKK